MGSTDFGNFAQFCAESTLPVCNILDNKLHNGSSFSQCQLTGIPLSDGRSLNNLGTILLCAVAILTSIYLIMRSERKEAAVGRREMQLFLVAYIVVSLCEIFSVGGIPLPDSVRLGFSAAHIAAITAAAWILLLNGIVGFQLIDDGTALSLGATVLSAAALFVGTGYIALDTGFSFTHHFDPSWEPPLRTIGLYVLYLLVPLICIVVFFVLESVLVLRILGEKKPMLYLLAAAVLFALAQVFEFVVSKYICTGTMGKINGALFETLFTLLSVVMVWVFWSSITEDDWSVPTAATYP